MGNGAVQPTEEEEEEKKTQQQQQQQQNTHCNVDNFTQTSMPT